MILKLSSKDKTLIKTLFSFTPTQYQILESAQFIHIIYFRCYTSGYYIAFFKIDKYFKIILKITLLNR